MVVAVATNGIEFDKARDVSIAERHLGKNHNDFCDPVVMKKLKICIKKCELECWLING
tara:strand:+ start:526 stop:699 length:174 start_codon:yes stop_codon:yes gene_type:complete